MNNADLPAMPVTNIAESHNTNTGEQINYISDTSWGLSKREMFAMAAMQGILSNSYWNEYGDYAPQDVAKAAAEYTDALLAELERTK